VTVVIFENINDPELGFTKEDVIEVVKTFPEAMLRLRVTGLEWFGVDQSVPVLRVEHDYLEVFHDALVKALAAKGIPVDTTFPEYKPHVTIPDEAALDRVWPTALMTGTPEVWWADEKFKVFK
jgi:hypothetical protein